MHNLVRVTGPGTNWNNLLESGRISLEKPSDSLESMKKEMQLLREQLEKMKIQIEERLQTSGV